MTGRLVSVEEAREWRDRFDATGDGLDAPSLPDFIYDLAFTVEQQGQRIAAVRQLHQPYGRNGAYCQECRYISIGGSAGPVPFPCPTARALGVES